MAVEKREKSVVIIFVVFSIKTVCATAVEYFQHYVPRLVVESVQSGEHTAQIRCLKKRQPISLMACESKCGHAYEHLYVCFLPASGKTPNSCVLLP